MTRKQQDKEVHDMWEKKKEDALWYQKENIKREVESRRKEEPTTEPFNDPRRKAIRSVNKVLDDILTALNK